jgi:hypothetical protein
VVGIELTLSQGTGIPDVCSERVAHFLRGLHDPLWLCRELTTFLLGSAANADAQNANVSTTLAHRTDETAQAAKPVFHPHAVIVIPFRILGKLI